MWSLKYEKEHYPAEEFALSGGLKCNGQQELLMLPYHSTDLLHTPVLDVSPNHDFSSIKLDCFLGESWVHAGSNRSSAVFAVTGMQFNG